MEKKNSHQVNHDQKSLPSKTECLMKSVSGPFDIVIYVSTNILELRKHWCIDAVAPDMSYKGLTSCFCQSLLQISKQQIKIGGWGRPKVHKSHTSLSITEGETSLSIAWCRGERTQSSDFCTPCCELPANLQSNISGSNRLPTGRSNPTLQECKRHRCSSLSSTDLLCKDFSGYAMSDSSSAIHFPSLQMQTGISAKVAKLCFIFEKPFVGTWFS